MTHPKKLSSRAIARRIAKAREGTMPGVCGKSTSRSPDQSLARTMLRDHKRRLKVFEQTLEDFQLIHAWARQSALWLSNPRRPDGPVYFDGQNAAEALGTDQEDLVHRACGTLKGRLASDIRGLLFRDTEFACPICQHRHPKGN